MPTIRRITAMIAGVIVVVAACKRSGQTAPRNKPPHGGIASPDRISAGGVAPARQRAQWLRVPAKAQSRRRWRPCSAR